MSKTNTNTYLIEEKHLTALEVLFKYLADHKNYHEADDARVLLDKHIDKLRGRYLDNYGVYRDVKTQMPIEEESE